jgi:putative spermidine/putrescine transport system permease protein
MTRSVPASSAPAGGTTASRGIGVARRALRSQGPYWAILSPLLVILAIFYFGPILEVLWLSFSDPELGFGNYERIVTSDAVMRVFATTIRICFATTVLAVIIGYLIAYAMMHVGPRHRLWMFAFVIIPFWISVLVRAFAWLVRSIAFCWRWASSPNHCSWFATNSAW